MADESRIVKDPICGKDVDTLRARAVGIFGGVTYYFCSAECKAQYKDPRKTPRRDPTRDTPLPPHAPPPPDSGKVLAPPLKLVDVRSRTRESTKEAGAEPARPEGAAAESKSDGREAKPRKSGSREAVPEPAAEPANGKRAKLASVPAPAEEEAPLAPARSKAPLVSFLIVMLIIAGGVLLFTLKHK